MTMKRVGTVLAWLLVAFFAVGSATNIFAPAAIVEDYQRWGYPAWFHYVTGTLELIACLLLIFPVTRLAGSAIGGGVMAAALATMLWNSEYAHGLAPLAVLAFVCINAWMTWRIRTRTARA
ncbi:DoxX family protein [Rhodobium gokarnense]|uniref:Membrane protein YphA (DoxX/SURF4 family) n=1 Tax=Rhodobium gokarnense TaxID=364296 RepID=A0ABT3HF60_9HYPH|nr:DoxX family protein [Rhodobium gokarnense]MCW2309038.1 putative membrane protein YphA (DoxX/SURF4 family) [Rhodobium gokarnense]